jgi:hypothetical protein
MKLRKLVPPGLVAMAIVDVVVSVTAMNWLSTRRNRIPVSLSQQQIEQRAIQLVQGWASPANITSVRSKRTTLGQLMGQPACSALEGAFRKSLVSLAYETYDPCDSNSSLWVVDLDGTFSFPRGITYNHTQVVYDATGSFIRADSP